MKKYHCAVCDKDLIGLDSIIEVEAKAAFIVPVMNIDKVLSVEYQVCSEKCLKELKPWSEV